MLNCPREGEGGVIKSIHQAGKTPKIASLCLSAFKKIYTKLLYLAIFGSNWGKNLFYWWKYDDNVARAAQKFTYNV